MKTIILALILFSSQASAWYVPGPGFFPCCPGPYVMPYGFGSVNINPSLQYPTFNYQQTVIVQEPPPPAQVIIREPPPRVIVEEREVCDSECERMRRYFRK